MKRDRSDAAILVVGSVALDTVRTPFGEVTDALGGSATHFSVAASFLAPVRLVAVVGDDFPSEHVQVMIDRGVDLEGLERAKGRTFRWSGVYGEDLNNPRTLDTQLNVFATFDPALPEAWLSTPVVFLANIDPVLQARVLDKVRAPVLVAADTMNYWIESKPEDVKRLLSRVHIFLSNDAEVRQLTGKRNLVDAAEEIRKLGPKVVVVKRGEHGVLVFEPAGPFAIPAYPLQEVRDPTGAGDAFAGGFLGSLAADLGTGGSDFRRAAVMGSVMASFQVESFSLERVRRLTPADIEARYLAFERLTRFPTFSR
jgi:sugar/nucleoside kinase (ribokinase family)